MGGGAKIGKDNIRNGSKTQPLGLVLYVYLVTLVGDLMLEPVIWDLTSIIWPNVRLPAKKIYIHTITTA